MAAGVAAAAAKRTAGCLMRGAGDSSLLDLSNGRGGGERLCGP